MQLHQWRSAVTGPRTLGCAPVAITEALSERHPRGCLAGQAVRGGPRSTLRGRGGSRSGWSCGCSDGTVPERREQGLWRPEEHWLLPEGFQQRVHVGLPWGRRCVRRWLGSAPQRAGQGTGHKRPRD